MAQSQPVSDADLNKADALTKRQVEGVSTQSVARWLRNIDQRYNGVSVFALRIAMFAMMLVLWVIAGYAWPNVAGFFGVEEQWRWLFSIIGFVIVSIIVVGSWSLHERVHNEVEGDEGNPIKWVVAAILINGLASMFQITTVAQNADDDFQVIEQQVVELRTDNERLSTELSMSFVEKPEVEEARKTAIETVLTAKEAELTGWGVEVPEPGLPRCAVSFEGPRAATQRRLCNEHAALKSQIALKTADILQAKANVEKSQTIEANRAQIAALEASKPDDPSLWRVVGNIKVGTDEMNIALVGLSALLFVTILELLLAVVCFLAARKPL